MDVVNLYLASKSVAERTGFRKQRYVTKDGRYIVNDRDLRNVSKTEQEERDGLDLTPVSSAEAARLIAENKYLTGNAADNSNKH